MNMKFALTKFVVTINEFILSAIHTQEKYPLVLERTALEIKHRKELTSANNQNRMKNIVPSKPN